jgi:hypothetical protein
MAKQHRTEEQLKADIFKVFSLYFDEPSPDRRQVYFTRICDLIISWSNECLKIKANEMGIEIYNLTQRLVKIDTKFPKDEVGFFKYLKTSLHTAEKEYYRNNKKNCIKIPRDIKNKLNYIDGIITLKESKLGRSLSENERRQCIPEKWFSIAEYTKLTNIKKIGSLEFADIDKASIDPEDEYFAKLDILDIRDALELVLKNTQDRTRECYRALFTAYCIDKSVNFVELVPLLDSEILKTHRKDGKKPKQRDIYLKYHPKVKQESASVRASNMTKDFLNKLRIVLNKIP